MKTASHPVSVLLPCEVDQGMFSSERAVRIDLGNFEVSLFADESLIIEECGKTFLRVIEMGGNGRPGNKAILLPSEAFETGSRWLTVPASLLLPAPLEYAV